MSEIRETMLSRTRSVGISPATADPKAGGDNVDVNVFDDFIVEKVSVSVSTDRSNRARYLQRANDWAINPSRSVRE